MTTFPLKRGDRLPRYRCRLTQGGRPIDLTTATSVKLTMQSKSTGTDKIVLATATIVTDPPITPADGIVEYSWDGDDTNAVDAYHTEWQVMFGLLPVTVPNASYDEVIVHERLSP